MRLAKKVVDSNLLRHLQSDQSGYFKHARNAHFPRSSRSLRVCVPTKGVILMSGCEESCKSWRDELPW